MKFVLLEESSKKNTNHCDRLQEKLDEYNKNFYDTIHFFPEAYAKYKLDKNNESYERIERILNKNKSDMYELYISVNKKVEKQHKIIKKENVNIDVMTKQTDIMNDELKLLLSKDIASAQRKKDKVEYYRMQVVEVFYLLAGIGILSSSIYHLIK